MRVDNSRPEFPIRAVVTAGMPYGNKSLHLGHIGGVFVHADIYKRFLQDRLGKDNVIFVSGTDCYGSPIIEYYKKQIKSGEFSGSLEEFILFNHNNQKVALEAFNISTESYYTSAFGRPGEIHKQLSSDVLTELYQNGHLHKRSAAQFFDKKLNSFLNGRQVIGMCPVPGCKSEKAYADECEMGHPYDPKDLINPTSILSGEPPEMKEVTNWYIDPNNFKNELIQWVNKIENRSDSRRHVISTIKEFLEPPVVYIKNESKEALELIKGKLPGHETKEDKKSISLIFTSLEQRELAVEILNREGLRFRAGKTLTPFRITGNIEWSINVPEIDGLKDLTFWVWPESLWAPISFTKCYLESHSLSSNKVEDWWSSEDSTVYQFMGEDNIFFYSLAEMSLFMGLEGRKLQFPKLIANCHLLQGNRKASSSGEIKPIMALDLLEHYTPDQLRAHFFALGLGMRPINFNPKPFNKEAKEKDADPVLKEGNLLSNVLNRICRSCFYTTQKYFDGVLPYGEISSEVLEGSKRIILEWERRVYNNEFHKAMFNIEKYIRGISKEWAKRMVKDINEDDIKLVLIDIFHMLRTAIFLLHPVAPTGTELVKDYLNVNDDFFNWDYLFKDIYYFTENPSDHKLKWLEPRVDFFIKHKSQF
ncbi:MAG: class I tRNA ligase family protein [Spirochaetaceae bacterium]